MASTIKVDNVQNQPGTNIINKCSVTTTIGAGAGDTINVCGATVNIGRCGGTVALACGATQTGFGRTGAVNWDTASIKTATFTAVSGSGYFCNTTAGIFNITMPASPSAGDIVGLKDYAGTFATNNLTIDRNGSKLDGESSNRALDTNYTSLTLVYVDGTQGWIPTEEGTGFVGESFIVATGGTPCAGETTGDYKYHTFTGPGSFCVSALASAAACNVVEYLVVAGGGGTGAFGPGGGGAGGFRFASPSIAPLTYPAKPLAGPAGITVTATDYPITVGGGGSPGAYPDSPSWSGATNGVNSVFSSITSAGGGRGGNGCQPSVPTQVGQPGGSGGGASRSPGTAGSGNDPTVSPSQGNDGGDSADTAPYTGGGGGGALAVGGAGEPSGPKVGGVGGGFPNAFGTSGESSGGFYYFSGGGGAGVSGPSGTGGAGGLGGGATGKNGGANTAGDAGTVNTGGGGGGAGGSNPSGANTGAGGGGGSGIVIIRYKFQ